MLFVIDRDFSLCSQVGNVRSDVRSFMIVPDICLIQLLFNPTLLIFLCLLNDLSGDGRLDSLLDVVDYLSSYIVGEESSLVDSFVCEQFIEFSLSFSIAVRGSVQEVLVDSH
jgi:hypothetical protein